MEYVVTKQYDKIGMSRNIQHLVVGSECYTENDVIKHNGIELCQTTSQDAYDYFSRNDDGHGLERSELVHEILDIMSEDDGAADARVEALEDDPEFQNLCRADYEGSVWIWGSEFYNADIDELEHVKELLTTTTEEYIEAHADEGTIEPTDPDDEDGEDDGDDDDGDDNHQVALPED